MIIPQEFESRVEVAVNGCWNWLGWTNHSRGGTGPLAPYGCFQRNKKFILAHRHFYELATGVNPGRNHVHHKCHNTLCVNPEHLEMVSQCQHNKMHGITSRAKNLEKNKYCANGHKWDEVNTHIDPSSGIRSCRACKREKSRLARRGKGIGPRSHKTHCPQGHPYSGDNLKLTAEGFHFCKQCNRDRSKLAHRRRREKMAKLNTNTQKQGTKT